MAACEHWAIQRVVERAGRAPGPRVQYGDTIATISKKWFRVRETYGVDVAAGEDTPLILAITVAIDSLSSRAG